MIVKKYTGSTETEAIMKAKDDLGSNAVVLNVKTMKQRGLGRLFKKDYVEITAALEEKDFASNVNIARPSFSNVQSRINLRVGDDTGVQNTQISAERASARTATDSKNSETIEKKLDSLHDMLRNQIGREDELASKNMEKAVPVKEENNINFKSLKLIYNKLIENEVDEKYANSIISDIESSMKKESNLDSILASVYQKIILKLGEPVEIQDNDRKKIIFFIGPTGVGKTTTIAKLASDMKLNREEKVAMITSDTYRIAAVEQLNTYASILDVPVNVVYTPSEINEAIDGYSDYETILVDTAGRSHKSTDQLEEVMEMIENVKETQTDAEIMIFLVLSVTTKYKDIKSICDAYGRLEDINLIFTKLDETTSLGNILNIKLYTGASLSYTTYGQNVPDDIEKADVQKIAKSLLGGE